MVPADLLLVTLPFKTSAAMAGLTRKHTQNTTAGRDASTPDDGPVLPSLADAVTLGSYGLGLWWAVGGPTWAGLGSILGDELDGRIARALNTTSIRGSNLDWGADVALTSLALVRLGRDTGHLREALIAAPAFLLVQAHLRARGWRPSVGSARALVMLADMLYNTFR